MSFDVEIEKLRTELNQIDDELIVLLKKRFDITEEIGKLKKEFNKPIINEEREREIINRLSDKIGESQHKEVLINLYNIIFKISQNRQEEL